MALDKNGNMIYGEGEGLFKEGSPYLDMVKGTYKEPATSPLSVTPTGPTASGLMGTFVNPNPSPTPAAAPAAAPLAVTPTGPTAAASKYWNGGAAATPEQLATAQAWAKGKTSDEIAAKGKEMNLSAEQFGSVFGQSGSAASGVGYGTDAGLVDSAKGLTWDGTKWVQPAATPTDGTGTGAGGSSTSTTSSNTTTTPANGVSSYQAAQTTVDPAKTTQGLMNSLLDEDSAYLKRARALSLEKMNERGLASSSFAQGAGVAAAIDAALGIAGPDAQIYNKTALSNTDATNQAGQFNAGANNALNLQNSANAYDSTKTDKLQAYDAAKTDKLQGFDLTKMDVAQKNELQRITSTMTMEQSNALAKMAQQQGYNLATMDAGQINDLAKMSTAQGYVKENLATNQAFDITKMDKAAAITLGQMDRQQINTLAQMATKFGYDMQTLSSQQAAAMAQLGANAETSKALAALNIDATKALNLSNQDFQTFTNRSNQATSIMRDLQTGLTAIDRDPNFTDAAAKTTMKDNLVKATRGALAVVNNAAGDAGLQAVMDSIFGP